MEDLDGDRPAVLDVFGEENGRHAAAAKLTLDAIAVGQRPRESAAGDRQRESGSGSRRISALEVDSRCVRDRLPVPPTLLRPLWVAVIATILFMVVATIQGTVRDGYDSWHQAVSALSLGPGGWNQAIKFVVFGVAVMNTAPVWRRILVGGTGAVAYPALIAVLGLSFIALGFVPQDPAPGYDPEGLALQAPTPLGLWHLAIAGVAAACSVAGLFVMAARFAGDPDWRGWSAYSRALAVLLIACVTIYGVWSVKPSGYAGTFERLAMVIPLIWTITLLRRLEAGSPIMHSRVAPGGSADPNGTDRF